MNPLDTQFHRRLKKLLGDEGAELASGLLEGNMEHLEYKRTCGYLKALGDVAAWCERIEKEMNEGK